LPPAIRELLAAAAALDPVAILPVAPASAVYPAVLIKALLFRLAIFVIVIPSYYFLSRRIVLLERERKKIIGS